MPEMSTMNPEKPLTLTLPESEWLGIAGCLMDISTQRANREVIAHMRKLAKHILKLCDAEHMYHYWELPEP